MTSTSLASALGAVYYSSQVLTGWKCFAVELLIAAFASLAAVIAKPSLVMGRNVTTPSESQWYQLRSLLALCVDQLRSVCSPLIEASSRRDLAVASLRALLFSARMVSAFQMGSLSVGVAQAYISLRPLLFNASEDCPLASNDARPPVNMLAGFAELAAFVQRLCTLAYESITSLHPDTQCALVFALLAFFITWRYFPSLGRLALWCVAGVGSVSFCWVLWVAAAAFNCALEVIKKDKKHQNIILAAINPAGAAAAAQTEAMKKAAAIALGIVSLVWPEAALVSQAATRLLLDEGNQGDT